MGIGSTGCKEAAFPKEREFSNELDCAEAQEGLLMRLCRTAEQNNNVLVLRDS
jgi:hypothetical protein